MKLAWTAIAWIGLYFPLCFGQTTSTEQTRYERWMTDLDYFENVYLTQSKTFSEDSIAACKQQLSELRMQVDSLNDNQLVLALSKFVAMANNGHTTIHLSKMDKIPLRFYRFAEGLFVVKTDKENVQYLGYQVLAINDIGVNEVEQKLLPYLSGIEGWRRFTATTYLSSPQVLNGIGLTNPEAMRLTLTRGQDTVTANFAVKVMQKDPYEYTAWSVLYPAADDPEWSHALPTGAALPAYLQHMQEGVFYEFRPEQKIAYFSINAYWYRCDDFKGKVKEFNAALKDHTDYNVVIDLRYFTGGNYMIPTKLATEPPQIIGNDQKIYLITSNMTFSAGLVTAARVKYYGGDQVVILGEPVGDSLVFWAEGDYYKLPNSGISIQDSKFEHDWESDKFVLGRTFFFNLFLGVPARSLAVDQEIRLSFEDYRAHRDPMLEWILAQAE